MNSLKICASHSTKIIYFSNTYDLLQELMNAILPEKYMALLDDISGIEISGDSSLNEIHTHIQISIENEIKKNIDTLRISEKNSTHILSYKNEKIYLNTRLEPNHELINFPIKIGLIVEETIKMQGIFYLLNASILDDNASLYWILYFLKKKGTIQIIDFPALNSTVNNVELMKNLEFLQFLGYITMFNNEVSISRKGWLACSM